VPLHELQQWQGEPAKDRDRRAAGILFRESLGICTHFCVLTHINHIDAVPYIPGYSVQKVHLPWRRWLDVVAREELCIVDWVKGIIPPGPDFDIKKLGASDVRAIAGSYVDAVLNGKDDYEAFSVIRWSEGV
jgi:hypothetical protein